MLLIEQTLFSTTNRLKTSLRHRHTSHNRQLLQQRIRRNSKRKLGEPPPPRLPYRLRLKRRRGWRRAEEEKWTSQEDRSGRTKEEREEGSGHLEKASGIGGEEARASLALSIHAVSTHAFDALVLCSYSSIQANLVRLDISRLVLQRLVPQMLATNKSDYQALGI